MNEYGIELVLTYGIAFGILLMVILYSFTRYIYSKEFLYLTYFFTQLFSLFYLISYSKLIVIDIFFQDVFLLLATLFAVGFSVSFFKGSSFPEFKTQKELLFYTLILCFILLTSLYHYFLFQYVPYTVIYCLLFISIVFNKKGEIQPSIIYVSGWSIFCLTLFLLDFKAFYFNEGYIDIVLVAFAIEALLFTLSVSYSYKKMKSQTKDYEDMLFKQSRLANSGEMIANITHQFRQPLNNISYILMNLNKRFQSKNLDEKYFEKKVSQANDQLQFMSKTIDDFTLFYAPSKHKEDFEVKASILNALVIIQSELKQKNIAYELDFKINDEVSVYGLKNELTQAILAILSNAKDALIHIQEPLINITVSGSSAEIVISIEDNGGGIPSKQLPRLFDAYFTTKSTGTGLGLYLSKKIIENSFNGNLQVSNTSKGAKFLLLIEKAIS